MRWPKSPGRDIRYSTGGFDINWPYSAQHMMDALARGISDQLIDEGSLPADLAAKRIRIRHHGHPFPHLGRRDWPRTVVHRLHYSRNEIRALKTAIVRWPHNRNELAAYDNRDVLEAEWDARFASAPPAHTGAAVAVWAEPAVTAIAQMAATSAQCSRIWTTGLLDEHQARVDLDAAMRHVASHAHRLWRTHADTHLDLGAPNHTDWDALIDTVDALIDYSRGLNGRADLLAAYRQILRLDDIDDNSLRIEFGLSFDDPAPVDRDALDQEVKEELDGAIQSLAGDAVARLAHTSAATR